MSSDKKNSGASDEYQYADEDAGEETLLEAPQKPKITLQLIKERLMERLPKKKKYRVLLVLAIAVYVLYKFIEVDVPPSKGPSASEKIAAQPLTKPPSEKAKAAVAMVKETEKKAPVAPAAIVAKPDVKQLDLGGANQAHPETVAIPSAQVRELQASLEQMNHSVEMLESSLLSLARSVVRLSDKVTALEKFQQEVTRTDNNQPAFYVYYLQSLTAGRAWVQAPTGELTSIKVGDFLPTYGRVEKIDANSGTVKTSSGRLIVYDQNNS